MGGTKKEPTGRKLAPVSPFPYFRCEDNYVATSAPKVIFISLRGQQGVFEKMPSNVITQGRGNATLAPPSYCPGEICKGALVSIYNKGGERAKERLRAYGPRPTVTKIAFPSATG